MLKNAGLLFLTIMSLSISVDKLSTKDTPPLPSQKIFHTDTDITAPEDASLPEVEVKRVRFSGTTMTIYLRTEGDMSWAQIKVVDARTKKLYVAGECITNYEVYIDDVKPGSLFYVQAREASGVVNGSDISYTYGKWSKKKYVVKQPRIEGYKVKANPHSLYIKWNKIKGAKSYTVYGRENFMDKWKKIGTTDKTSYTVKELAGKKINAKKKSYQLMVLAKAKIGKKTYTSELDDLFNYYYTDYSYYHKK